MNQAFVDQARTYLGVPFRHCGRNRMGVDCVGLITCVGYDLGITDYDTGIYREREDPRAFIAEFRKFCRRVASAEPGDILLIASNGRYPMHCAVFAGDTLIHSLLQRRGVVEEAYALWADKVTHVMRVGV